MATLAYEDLVAETTPRVIETGAEYVEMSRRLGQLIRKGPRRAKAETQFMRLLSVLVRDYDRRNRLPPDESAPANRLRFLLEHSAKTSADLLPVFGQRSHVNEALNGKRIISADHARKLGKIFRVKPGLFI